MDCPKCTHSMLPVEYGTEIKISRCNGCGGIFCNRQTLERMRAEWLVDTVLDTGSATEGAKNNQIQDIPCPGCGTRSRLEHVVSSSIRKSPGRRV